jgi:crotonobetainyl-CoA:carnitine CoA-transferase CaiB-like acyl-CoA transferase
LQSPLLGNTRIVASPLNVEGLPRAIRSPTPEPGAHTDEVLSWLGYTDRERAALGEAGVTRPKAG